MDFKSHVPKIEQNINVEDNPWKVSSIFEFHYFCCPECDCKSETKQDFVHHASTYHTWALETLRQISDGSLDDIYFPGSNPVDFKGFNIKEESIDETTLERDNDIVVKNEVFDDDVQPEYYLADYQNDFDIDENDEAQENVKKAVTKKIKCELCDYHGSSLRKHMQQVHEKVMSYLCTICNNDFTSEKYLKNHVATVHEGKKPAKTKLKKHTELGTSRMIKCKICDFHGLTGDFKRHMAEVHEKKRLFKCDICLMDFTRKSHMKNHVRRVHEKKKLFKPYKCEICSKMYAVPSDLRLHVATIHEGKKPYSCKECIEMFASKQALLAHTRRKHTPEGISEERLLKFYCQICEKEVHGKVAHNRKFHDKKVGNLKCPKCDKTFKRPELEQMQTKIVKVKVHILNMHEKTPCTICGAMIGQKLMSRHIQSRHTENGDKKYTCKICPKGFTSNQMLQDHINVHTGNKPHMCKFCGASFASVGNHRMHERGHMGHKRRKENEIHNSIENLGKFNDEHKDSSKNDFK